MLYRLSKEDNTIELMPYADFEKNYELSQLLIIDGDKYDFVENQADRNYVLDLIEDRLVTLGNLSAKQAEKLKKERRA